MLSSKDIEEKLKKERRIEEEKDAKRRAETLGLKYLDLISVRVPTEIKAMELVPEAEAKKALLVPLQLVRKKLVLAVFDPNFSAAKDIISELRKKYEVEIVITSHAGLEHGWSYYQYIHPEATDISGGVDINEEHLKGLQEKMKTLSDVGNELEKAKGALTSQILETILAGAQALKASDIHLEPTQKTGTLRFRIDGLLHTASDAIAEATYHSVVMRVKLLSNLKLNIHDQAQDGRFTIHFNDRDIEIRTSIIPSEWGETIVMRLLDPLALKVNLEELGWRADDLAIVKEQIKEPNGLILNTGPTGSGKTTTLYAFLKYVWKPEIKVITVEDPIEYHLDGISQTQVDPQAGYTFASGLRSILRQDPNVILVGEIRDSETADIAMNASLTGHIVFSTLHTNDAVGAVPRLLDLGAKPQILGPALSLVIAQRLARILCPHCKKEKKTDAKTKKAIEGFLKQLPSRVNTAPYQTFTTYEAKGCTECGNLGYRGRTSIFELFVVTPAIEEAIYKNPTELLLKQLARDQQMTTMQEDGILKVLTGVTSFDEVTRLTGPIEWLK